MNLPLIIVISGQFLEFLEFSPFKIFVTNNSSYFRHVDDILLIYPWNNVLTNITNKISLNQPLIFLTNKKLTTPFMDILLMNNNSNLEIIINSLIKMTWYIFIHIITPK